MKITFKTESIDISNWKLSSNILIIFHGKIYKLPRDTTKTFPDIMKHAMSMKKRYGIIFLYKPNKLHYLAFFDSIEKCRIFITTNDQHLSQLNALCTELWNLKYEFNTIRYANSFKIGLSLVIETKKKFIDTHGIKRYLQALSTNQAQKWFHSINEILDNYDNNNDIEINNEDNKLDDEQEDFELEEEDLE